MRQIKFRGKKVRGGEWVYGDLIHLTAPNGIEGCVIITNDKIEDVFPDNKLSKAVLEYTDEEVAVVLDNTVGQFTGLHDKNGKEIYEADIISRKYTIGPHCCFSEGKEEINYIGFRQSECKFIVVCANRHHDLYEPYNIHVEVIGNIHDNPELLNRKNK